MNILKNILARIMAVWALLTFVASLLLVALPTWIIGFWPEPKRSRMMHVIFVSWMDFFFLSIGLRRIIKGKNHFQKGQPYIVVCNHSSFMDVPLSSPGIPGPNKTIAKIEMARIPLFGLLYKRGSVLVDRKSEESRRHSYSKMKEVLNMGLHMCIYPEGTRNKTAAPLQRFHDGAFRLSVETGKPIIPALIFHTRKVMPINKTFYLWPHPIEMHFLAPVDPAGLSVAELRDKVHGIMLAFLTGKK
ncbi:MAG TPA: lysophospholipid acyltransferase family protein [Chitinophagaceae bacterium]|nr:lysophospholipid acyltransferase family protein [Chitinophagaceae bacterium]